VAEVAPTIAILGPGGIGGLLAALFWRHGLTVSCIAKEDSVGHLRRNALVLRSGFFGDITARPRFVSRLDTKPTYLFITTKANELRKALESLHPELLADTILCPLLNGVEHFETLRHQLLRPVVVAMIGKVEAKKLEPGVVAHMSSGSPEIEMAAHDVPAARLEEMAQLLRDVGLRVTVCPDEQGVVWRKLVRLNALACVTAVTNRPLGFARENAEWRNTLIQCVREGVAVASYQGVTLDAEDVVRQIDALPAGLTTSLQRSIAAGDASELEAIPGAVLRAAECHGVNCRTIRSMYESLRARERDADCSDALPRPQS
jgi:2-dehydropantoate 2-reductase